MLTVLFWWLWLALMGLAALPLAYRFFRRLPDRGYAFARPLGLLLTSYLLWLGGSLGLLRNSLGGALFSLFLVAAISLAVYRRGRAAAASSGEADPGLLAWLRSHGRLVLSVELLFAGALALWSLLRAYSPELTTAGGEKFMEIMYLNSIGRSDFFPPHDAWLSGYAISYYYFGYVMMATLTRLSGLPAHLTFNVGLASLFALTCTGAFGLVYNLVAHHATGKRPVGFLSDASRDTQSKGTPSAEEHGEGQKTRQISSSTRPIGWGFLGAVLVAVLGNLEGFLEVLYSARLLPEGFWRWLDIVDINQPFDLSAAASLMPARSGWWWWRASRVIHDLDPLGNSIPVQPIDEFPGFSFLLGDMHAHVLALPFVLLALALALRTLLWGLEGGEAAVGDEPWWAPFRRLPLLVPLALGGLLFLNTWDFPIYWLIFVGAYGLGRWPRYGGWRWPFLRDVGLTAGAVAVLGFVLYFPFYVGFQSQAGGLLPTLYVGTRFRQYFVMFGPFLVAIAGLLVMLARRSGRGWLKSWLGWTAALILVPLGMMLLLVLALLLTPSGREMLEGIRRVPAVYAIVGDEPWIPLIGRLLLVKLRTWLMPLVVAAMAGLGLVFLQRSLTSDRQRAKESFSEEDIKDPSGTNAQADASPDTGWQGAGVRFVLLCAVAGLILTLSVEFFYLVDNFGVRANTIFKFYFQAWVLMAIASAFAVYWLTRRRGALRLAFQVGFWLLFALGMVYPVLGNVSRAGNFEPEPTLDGTAYLASSQPADYDAIAWLNQNVQGAPVILETPGTGGSSYVYEGRVSALTGLPALLGWAGHEGQWRGSYTVQHAREPDIQTIYNTLDVEAARSLLEQYDVTYVYVGPVERSQYEPRGLQKFARFMDVAYENDGVTIYRVRD
jgi:YYY domain-containing protein